MYLHGNVLKAVRDNFLQWKLQTSFKKIATPQAITYFGGTIWDYFEAFPPPKFRLLPEKRTGTESRKWCQVLFSSLWTNILYSWAALCSYNTEQPLWFRYVALLCFTLFHKDRVWNVICIISVSRRWERTWGARCWWAADSSWEPWQQRSHNSCCSASAEDATESKEEERERSECDGSANEPLNKADSTDSAPKRQHSKRLWQTLQTTYDSALWGLFLWAHTAVLRPKRGKAVGKP